MAGQKLAPSQLSFITLCLFFEHVARSKGNNRVKAVHNFMKENLVRPSNDLFSVLRLMLPQVSPAAAISSSGPPVLPAQAGCCSADWTASASTKCHLRGPVAGLCSWTASAATTC